eukprot:2269982-Pleurochrysis_carterae.AAC.2
MAAIKMTRAAAHAARRRAVAATRTRAVTAAVRCTVAEPTLKVTMRRRTSARRAKEHVMEGGAAATKHASDGELCVARLA